MLSGRVQVGKIFTCFTGYRCTMQQAANPVILLFQLSGMSGTWQTLAGRFHTSTINAP